MARPLRIEYEGAFYHVTSRGNDRKKIFLSPTDYKKFLSYLSDAVQKYGVILHAFILMGNHYHLIVETPKSGLSAFMHAVNSAYTTYFNIKRKRAGHLFQGRYRSVLIEKDSYLLELSRYIHLNPVRAGLVEKPEDYPYSSYRSYLSPKEETIVFRDLLWGMISGDGKEAPQRYSDFVASAISEKPPSPLDKVYGGMILGGKSFIQEALKRASDLIAKVETAQRRALTSRVSGIDEMVRLLSIYFKVPEATITQASPYRAYAIYLSRKHTPVSSTEIGGYFGNITCSAVTKIGTRLKGRMSTDAILRDEIKKLEERLFHVNG